MREIIATTLSVALLLAVACSSRSTTHADLATDQTSTSDGTVEADLPLDQSLGDSPLDTTALDASVPSDDLTSEGDLGDTLPATVESICTQLAQATCAAIPTCCQGITLRYATVEACVSGFEAECLTRSTKEAAALQSGSAVVDLEKLEQCVALTAQAANACHLVSNLEQKTICAGIFVAVAGPGEVCPGDISGMWCAAGKGVCFPEPSGTSCKLWSGDQVACSNGPCSPELLCITSSDSQTPSVCDAPRETNEPCVADVHCASGLACFDNVCQPGLNQGVSCKSSFKCGSGLTCDPADEVCAPRLGLDAACVSPTQCESGLSCYGVQIGQVCGPGEPGDGKDDSSLPTLFEPCTDLCQLGLRCQIGPIPGRCIPDLCNALAPPPT
ncbi:MAG: hypothetical protein KC609_22780 [Myxococcales bacterium]|nr:hypothetical protein [Myxococcales bacterium]